MKTITLIFIALFLNTQLSISQEDLIIHYASNGQITDPEKATERIEIHEVRKNILETKVYEKVNDKWELSPRKERVKIINDTTYNIFISYSQEKGETIIRKYSKKGDYYLFQDFYKRKKIKQEGFTSSIYPLHLEGELRTYHKNGYVASLEVYEDNKLLSNKNWKPNGERYIDNIHVRVDRQAQYPGGFEAFWEYIDQNLTYPGMAKQLARMGTVNVKFVVDSTGDVVGEMIDKGVDPLLDAEALRLIKDMSVQWEAATIDGKAVNTSYTVPIDFSFSIYEN